METHGGNGSPRPVRPFRGGKVHGEGDRAYNATSCNEIHCWCAVHHDERRSYVLPRHIIHNRGVQDQPGLPDRSSQCGMRGVPGITANLQHSFCPSWSERLLVAPHSVGPAVPGLTANPQRHTGPSCSVCGSWPLLAVWKPPVFPALTATHSWSLLEYAAPGRSSRCGTRGFPGSTAKPERTRGPSWSVQLLAAPCSMGPRFSWVYRQPTFASCSLAKNDRRANSEDVPLQDLVERRGEQHSGAATVMNSSSGGTTTLIVVAEVADDAAWQHNIDVLILADVNVASPCRSGNR